MKTMKLSKANPSSKRRLEAGELLKRAMRQPGIADLMQVYESWRKYEEVSKTADLIKATRQITSLSTSSGPLLREG